MLKNYHPLPSEVLKYRHLSKLKNTYVDAIPGHIHKLTGRVHTTLNQTITTLCEITT